MTMNKIFNLPSIVIFLTTFTFIGNSLSESEKMIEVIMKNNEGKILGSISLFQKFSGVLFRIDLHSLPPGSHGFHVHEIGLCEDNFKTAGPHFNPEMNEHGFENSSGHAGAMVNIFTYANGEVKADIFNHKVNIMGSNENSILGRSLIIHEDPDDYLSQPSGAAGARIACGQIEIP